MIVFQGTFINQTNLHKKSNSKVFIIIFNYIYLNLNNSALLCLSFCYVYVSVFYFYSSFFLRKQIHGVSFLIINVLKIESVINPIKFYKQEC